MGGNMQDRMEVLMSKIRAGETVVIDVAVIKATMQNPKPPKDKHVAVLKMACAAASPRMQVQYTVHKLSSRLEDKPGWLVALKTLMVFHRLMREVDPSFQVSAPHLRYSVCLQEAERKAEPSAPVQCCDYTGGF
eukprot:63014-Pelagomonas_calceolata.AAC.1